MSVARIEIKCAACGTTFTHRRECRNSSDAESYTAWAREHIVECPECRRARLREEEAAKAAKATESLDLVQLTGTEKQIAWAEDLRRKHLAWAVSLDGIDRDKLAEAANLAPAAKWWIDHRQDTDVARLEKLSQLWVDAHADQ